MAAMVTASAVPPKLTKGSGIPVIGSSPIMEEMLKNA